MRDTQRRTQTRVLVPAQLHPGELHALYAIRGHKALALDILSAPRRADTYNALGTRALTECEKQMILRTKHCLRRMSLKRG